VKTSDWNAEPEPRNMHVFGYAMLGSTFFSFYAVFVMTAGIILLRPENTAYKYQISLLYDMPQMFLLAAIMGAFASAFMLYGYTTERMWDSFKGNFKSSLQLEDEVKKFGICLLPHKLPVFLFRNVFPLKR